MRWSSLLAFVMFWHLALAFGGLLPAFGLRYPVGVRGTCYVLVTCSYRRKCNKIVRDSRKTNGVGVETACFRGGAFLFLTEDEI